MNHTESVRRYIRNLQGKILDVAFVYDRDFSHIEKRTFLKILKRLEEGGALSSISKGVYYVGSLNGVDVNTAVRDYYVGSLDGMMVGDELYRELGVSDHEAKFHHGYTNKVANGKNKNVGGFVFAGADLLYTPEVRELIKLLELIEKRRDIVDLDIQKYAEVRTQLLEGYSDTALTTILKSIPYQVGTIAVLAESLGATGKYNQAMEIYERVTKE